MVQQCVNKRNATFMRTYRITKWNVQYGSRAVEQGSSNPVRNRAAQQEVSGGWAGERGSFISRSPSLASPPEPSPLQPPRLRKNCLPRNWPLEPKRLGTAALEKERRVKTGVLGWRLQVERERWFAMESQGFTQAVRIVYDYVEMGGRH